MHGSRWPSTFVLALALSVATLPATAAPQSQTRPRAHAPSAGPALKSSTVYVLDETHGEVVLSRQADSALPIASITKLMTALVVLESGQALDEVIPLTDQDRTGTRSSASRLEVGTNLSRADLLHLALMSSENRAAHALARAYPGGVAACVAAMNAKAEGLGMASARFTDPTGLDSTNVASGQDLAKLVQAAAKLSVIQQYSTDASYTVPVRRRRVEFRNTDSLVRAHDWNIVVQKTGYISEAGRCLVMKAIFQGRSVVIVLLDSNGKYTRVADARRIRKWMETHSVADASRSVARRD
jgi:D-alanyl-D-alanine endopeptidase (penicillin-binding protein 7)